MVANVGHLKQVRIQPGLAQTVAEQRFVSARRATGNDDPVQIAFFDYFADVFDAVLGAGVEVGFGVADVGESGGVVGNGRYVHKPGNIRPTVADKNANARLLGRYVPLRRKFNGFC